MNTLKIILGFSLISTPVLAAKNECRYGIVPSSVKVVWTAYKTTEKTPVQGALTDLMIKTPPKGSSSLKAALAQTKVSGTVKSEKNSDSGNPARDLTLFQKFFNLISNEAAFQGSLNHIKGDDKAGAMNLLLGFNKKSRDLPLKYSLSADGAFEAVGGFDMNDFGLETALASLHLACEALHKGKDGVSKTWPDVGLKLTAKINKDCSKK